MFRCTRTGVLLNTTVEDLNKPVVVLNIDFIVHILESDKLTTIT